VNRVATTLLTLPAALLVLAACGGTSDPDAPATTVDAAADTTVAITTTTTKAAPDGLRVKDGDLVRVHYTGTLEDGTEFDSSRGREPLEFVVASGQVIAGFDDAVRGLAVGESRTQRVEPIDGYGETDPSRIIEVPLDQLPPDIVVGDQLSSQSGQQATVMLIDTDAGIVRLDANHSLAGKVLIFDVELVEIVPADG